MPKFLFLTKLFLKKYAASRQAIRWTPILIQHQLQNDALKSYLFGLMGVPTYFSINKRYLDSMRFQNNYNFLSFKPSQGLSGLQSEQSFSSLNARQGDFKEIKGNQFVHSVQIVQNPMQMDEFSLNDVESVMSDFEYDEEFNNSQMSESLVLSWNDSTAMESLSSVGGSKQQFAF